MPIQAIVSYFWWVCRYADQQMSWQISVHVKPGEKHTQIEWLIDEKVNLWIFRTTGERKVSTNCLSEWNNQMNR